MAWKEGQGLLCQFTGGYTLVWTPAEDSIVTTKKGLLFEITVSHSVPYCSGKIGPKHLRRWIWWMCCKFSSFFQRVPKSIKCYCRGTARSRYHVFLGGYPFERCSPFRLAYRWAKTRTRLIGALFWALGEQRRQPAFVGPIFRRLGKKTANLQRVGLCPRWLQIEKYWKWTYDLKHGGVSKIFLHFHVMLREGRSFMKFVRPKSSKAQFERLRDPFFFKYINQLDIPRDHLWKISRTRTADLSFQMRTLISSRKLLSQEEDTQFPIEKEFRSPDGLGRLFESGSAGLVKSSLSDLSRLASLVCSTRRKKDIPDVPSWTDNQFRASVWCLVFHYILHICRDVWDLERPGNIWDGKVPNFGTQNQVPLAKPWSNPFGSRDFHQPHCRFKWFLWENPSWTTPNLPFSPE